MALDADGPTLDTDRLRLRPPRLDNLRWSHARISSDPRVAWDSESSTIIESLKGLENRIAHWREHGFGMWAVFEKASDEPLGFAGLVALEGTDEVQVGYHLAQRAWSKGYATEVGRASLRYGFEVLGLSRVVAVVRPENVASQRVPLKLGLTHVRDEEHYGFMTQALV